MRVRGSRLVARFSPALVLALAASLTPSLAAETIRTAGLAQVPAQPYPDYLRPVADPVFGGTITRITDPLRPIGDTGYSWEHAARHRYSSSQSWNTDQSLMAIEKGVRGMAFLDGRTRKPLFQRDVAGACEWHPLRAALMLCVDDNVVFSWNVRRDTRTVLFRTTSYDQLEFGPGKGNPSADGTMLAVRAKDKSGRRVAFAIDLEKGQKLADIALDELPGSNSYVSISPSGRYIFVMQKNGSINQAHVFTREGVALQHWLENHRPGHGDMTIDADGSDVMVGISKSAPDAYHVIKRRLADGQVTVLSGRGLAQHVSARNTRQPGWVIVSYGGSRADVAGKSSMDPFYQEVLALRIDGSGAIRRLAPTRSVRGSYDDEAQASPAPDGTKVVFASDWGDSRGTVADYLVEPAGRVAAATGTRRARLPAP